MGFDDYDRKHLTDALQHEKLIREFFAKNREKIKKNNAEAESTTKWAIENGDISKAEKDLLQVNSIIAVKTFDTFSDVLDLIEITLIQNTQIRSRLNELVNIMQETELDRKSALAKISDHEKSINNLSSHKQALEWIDNYFKRSSETSPK